MVDTSVRSNIENHVYALPINERPLGILNQMNMVNQYIKILNDAIDFVANTPITTLNKYDSYTCFMLGEYLIDNGIGYAYWRDKYFDTMCQLFIIEELPKYLRDPKVICGPKCSAFITAQRVSNNTNLTLGELRLKWLAYLKAKVNESHDMYLKQDIPMWNTLE